jgi:hypothetical protein
MKKLKLHRETIKTLTSSNLELVHGGGPIGTIIVHTNPCPVLTNGCTGGCMETILTSGSPVIIPSGG